MKNQENKLKLKPNAQDISLRDMVFLYEAMFDLNKHGWVEGGKAHTMLNDWLSELKEKAGIKYADEKEIHIVAEDYTGLKID